MKYEGTLNDTIWMDFMYAILHPIQGFAMQMLNDILLLLILPGEQSFYCVVQYTL